MNTILFGIHNIDGPKCWYCDSTEELSPRERAYDSAPLEGWECKECRDASRHFLTALRRSAEIVGRK